MSNILYHLASARLALATHVLNTVNRGLHDQRSRWGSPAVMQPPRPHKEQHAITNAPTVHIGGHSILVSFGQHTPGEVLLWIGKRIFTKFPDGEACAKYVLKWLSRNGPVTPTNAPAHTPVAAQPVKVRPTVKREPTKMTLTEVFPRPKDYRISTFQRVGLHAFWTRVNGVGKWLIAVCEDASKRDIAIPVRAAHWQRMQLHGIRSTFATL